MDFKDYYKILGVDDKANEKTIKTAYRKLARKYHPDVSEHNDAEAKFKEVSEAYEVLKSADKRAEYDDLRQYGSQGQSFRPPPGWKPSGGGGQADMNGDFSDFFSSIFGQSYQGSDFQGGQRSGGGFQQGRQAHQAKGQDVETEIAVLLEDTLKESSQKISYQIADLKKVLNVKIPAGIYNDERIRLKGQGAPGHNGGGSGDLYLRARLIPHPLFDVEDHNLVIVLPIAPWEAALGAKIEVPTLAGSVLLSVPKNSQSGQRLRVKGKGLLNRQGQASDLYAVLKIVVPNNDPKADKHWHEMAEELTFDPREKWSKSK